MEKLCNSKSNGKTKPFRSTWEDTTFTVKKKEQMYRLHYWVAEADIKEGKWGIPITPTL